MPGPGDISNLAPRVLKALDRPKPAAAGQPAQPPDGLLSRDELALMGTPADRYGVPATYPPAAPGPLDLDDIRARLAKLPPAKQADLAQKLADFEAAAATLKAHGIKPENAAAKRAETQVAVTKLQAQMAAAAAKLKPGEELADPPGGDKLLSLLDACTGYVLAHDDLVGAL